MVKSLMSAAALAIGILLAGAPSAQAQQVVDRSFDGISFDWSRIGGMIIRYKAFISEGELVICGAYSNTGGRDQTRLGRQVMREAVAKLNGTRVRRNLSFFKTVNSSGNDVGLVGQETSCAGTGVAATQADLATFEVVIRSGRYRT